MSSASAAVDTNDKAVFDSASMRTDVDAAATKDNPTTANMIRVPLSPAENLSVGAFGGALETCLQMPILTYKFCLQEGRALPTSVSGWYRGVGVQAGQYSFFFSKAM
jgi:hypothetical protein